MDIASGVQLDINAFIGKSVALLGITGSGKTNTAAVLIEELLGQGLPMTIVDIEGEYWGLKERYDLLIAGRSEHAELQLSPENAGALAQASITRGLSVILDLSEYTQEETYEFLVTYFTVLWQQASLIKKPYQIILEEAHEFIPQGASTPLKQLLTRIALRGRKRGLGIVLISQRSAKVEKDVLTQVPMLFLHKVVHPIDMRVYKDLIPLAGITVESIIADLHPGQAVVVADNMANTASIRLRHTFHAGSTPTLEQVSQPELRRVDASLLRDLQAMIAASSKETPKDEKRFEKRVKELEAVLAVRDATIIRMQEQIDTLSRLSVSMPDVLEISQATVHTMNTHNGSVEVIEALPISKPMTQQQITAPLNEVKFNAFKKRLNSISALHKDVLKLLTEHGERLNIAQIAAWLNRSEATIRNNPPYTLINMGLVDRLQLTGGYHYRSLLKQRLASDFPGVDVDILVHRLLP